MLQGKICLSKHFAHGKMPQNPKFRRFSQYRYYLPLQMEGYDARNALHIDLYKHLQNLLMRSLC